MYFGRTHCDASWPRWSDHPGPIDHEYNPDVDVISESACAVRTTISSETGEAEPALLSDALGQIVLCPQRLGRSSCLGSRELQSPPTRPRHHLGPYFSCCRPGFAPLISCTFTDQGASTEPCCYAAGQRVLFVTLSYRRPAQP